MRSRTDRVTQHRGRRGARAAAFLAFGAALAMSAVTGGALIASGTVVPDFGLILLAVLSMATVGSILAIRVPANLVGWLLLVSAVVLSAEFLGLVYAEWSRIYFDGSLPGTAVAAWIYSNLFAVPVLIMVVGIPLIYPNGRLLSPRWRWLVAVLIWSLVTFTVREGLRPGLISDTTFENPFGIAGIEPWLDVLQLPDVFGVALFVGAIASVVIRYRRAGHVERQQLKWLIAATALSVVAWSIVTIGQAVGAPTVVTIGWIFALLCFSAIPIAIGIAVLRYRLYEIDRIISRTIAWTLVTGVLVAVFASVVVMLQTALVGITQGQTLAVAGFDARRAGALSAAAAACPARRGPAFRSRPLRRRTQCRVVHGAAEGGGRPRRARGRRRRHGSGCPSSPVRGALGAKRAGQDMTRPVVARWIAVVLAGGAVVTTIAGTGMSLADQIDPGLLLGDIAVLAMVAVGTLLAIRIPGNAIGWLLLVAALCLGIEWLGVSYMNLSLKVAAGTFPGTAAAAWLYVLFTPAVAVIMTILLIYPDGRLLSPRWRWVVAMLVYAAATTFVHDAFRPGPMPYTDLDNPFGIAAVERFLPQPT